MVAYDRNYRDKFGKKHDYLFRPRTTKNPECLCIRDFTFFFSPNIYFGF